MNNKVFKMSIFFIVFFIGPYLILADVSTQSNANTTFQYLKLFIETLTSPQILILLIILLLLKKRPKIIDRIAMLDIAGVKLQITELKESVDATKSGLSQIEEKLELVKRDYIESSEQFDPIASAKDIDKLGTYLKSVAASLDNIDFVTSHLNLKASQGEVYAAACAIQVRPQPKFLKTLTDYFFLISKTNNLGGLRLRIVYKLVQCIENILRSDNRKTTKVLDEEPRQFVKQALKNLANHPICVEDDKKNGEKGIVHRINRVLRLIENNSSS